MAFGQFLTHSMSLTSVHGGFCVSFDFNYIVLELDCCKIQSSEPGCFNIDIRQVGYPDKSDSSKCSRNDPYYQLKSRKGCGKECQCRPFFRSHFTAVRVKLKSLKSKSVLDKMPLKGNK